MKKTTLVRAIRLLLLAALAVNVAVVVVTPLYRAREAANAADPPVAPADAFDSLPVSSPPPAKTQQPPADSLPSPPPPAPDEEQTSVAQPVVDEIFEHSVATPDERVSEEEANEESVAGFGAAEERLVVVGETLAQLNHRSSTLSLPIARAAGRLTQWLAHTDTAPASPAASASDTDLVPRTAPVEQTGQPTDVAAADPPRIVIHNRPENQYPVAFLLEERVQTLAPGEQLTSPSAEATVRFDRGRSFGETRRELNPGLYHFVVSAEGWKLQQQD